MVLLDVLGKRWTLRVLWELRDGPLSFRALRDRCDDVSPSVLNARVGELRELALIDATNEGYSLAAQGRSLCELLLPLDAWARRWDAQRSRARGSKTP
jgi:DNA-binding HxlR family transcriptional regulator